MQQFINRVLIASGIVALFIIVILIFRSAFSVMLLIFAGVLIGVYFRGLSYWLAEKTELSNRKSLAIVVIGTLLVVVLTGWLLGAKIQSQMVALEKKLPDSSQEFKKQVAKYEWGSKILQHSRTLQNKLSGQKIYKTARSFFKTTFGILGDLYIIIFIGIFFTVDPAAYVNSIVALVPLRKRSRTKDILRKIGITLRDWLLGKIFAMFVVAILTAIGLIVAGIPMALALAVIAGLLNFIPNFGPILAMVPAALVALSKDTTSVYIVVALYIGIQVLESNVITPMVQKRLIEIPPAYIIIAQVAMGTLTGGLGVILATPLIAVLMVLIQMLYIDAIEQ